MEKKKIYIIGGCRGCGATFVAAGLAFAMGRRPEGEKKGIAYLEGVSHDEDFPICSQSKERAKIRPTD